MAPFFYPDLNRHAVFSDNCINYQYYDRMNDEQQAFLERLALRIPRLFDVIRQGNVKSEYIIGIRQIEDRHVRLKIVAEVVDPGVNPLATHSMSRSQGPAVGSKPPDSRTDSGHSDPQSPASRRRRPRRR